MTETKLQTKFTAWMKSGRGFDWIHAKGHSACAFELKLAKGFRLPFSKVPDHQEIALLGSSGRRDTHNLTRWASLPDNSGLFHKISDSAIGYKPFDCFALRGAGAYIVIGFWHRFDDVLGTCSLRVVAVPIEKWLAYRQECGRTGGRGSLAYKKAREIGEELDI